MKEIQINNYIKTGNYKNKKNNYKIINKIYNNLYDISHYFWK